MAVSTIKIGVFSHDVENGTDLLDCVAIRRRRSEIVDFRCRLTNDNGFKNDNGFDWEQQCLEMDRFEKSFRELTVDFKTGFKDLIPGVEVMFYSHGIPNGTSLGESAIIIYTIESSFAEKKHDVQSDLILIKEHLDENQKPFICIGNKLKSDIETKVKLMMKDKVLFFNMNVSETNYFRLLEGNYALRLLKMNVDLIFDFAVRTFPRSQESIHVERRKAFDGNVEPYLETYKQFEGALIGIVNGMFLNWDRYGLKSEAYAIHLNHTLPEQFNKYRTAFLEVMPIFINTVDYIVNKKMRNPKTIVDEQCALLFHPLDQLYKEIIEYVAKPDNDINDVSTISTRRIDMYSTFWKPFLQTTSDGLKNLTGFAAKEILENVTKRINGDCRNSLYMKEVIRIVRTFFNVSVNGKYLLPNEIEYILTKVPSRRKEEAVHILMLPYCFVHDVSLDKNIPEAKKVHMEARWSYNIDLSFLSDKAGKRMFLELIEKISNMVKDKAALAQYLCNFLVVYLLHKDAHVKNKLYSYKSTLLVHHLQRIIEKLTPCLSIPVLMTLHRGMDIVRDKMCFLLLEEEVCEPHMEEEEEFLERFLRCTFNMFVVY